MPVNPPCQTLIRIHLQDREKPLSHIPLPPPLPPPTTTNKTPKQKRYFSVYWYMYVNWACKVIDMFRSQWHIQEFQNGAFPRCAGPGSAFRTIVLTKSNQIMILFCLCTSCNSLSLLKFLNSPLCSVQLLASVFVLSILGQVRASVIIPTILIFLGHAAPSQMYLAMNL